MTDKNSTDLMHLDIATPASSLCLIGDVYVPGMVFNRGSFKSTERVLLELKGYFQEEFLCGLGRGVYIPSAILRAYQVVKRSDNKRVLKNISPRFAVVSPVHFLGYITYTQRLAEFFACIPIYGVLEVIAFTISTTSRRVLLMRAIFSSGTWNICVEDVHAQREWAPGTQVISRSLI